MEENNNAFKKKAMLVGGIGGALVGVIAATIFVKAAQEEADANDSELAITPTKGLQIGMLVVGLLKQLSSI